MFSHQEEQHLLSLILVGIMWEIGWTNYIIMIMLCKIHQKVLKI